jgi:hypothetical protein
MTPACAECSRDYFLFALSFSVFASPINKNTFAELRWRLIGPFRGGRTVAISGVEQQLNVF